MGSSFRGQCPNHRRPKSWCRTPIDITLSELAIEAFLPADARTAEILMG
jgi:hypothetical protein